ncbi:LOW QUALITY PROTEIN: Bardet-Biedl syndrome 10 protein [Lethenteron reissneri]|uniref:LOW QUALITY PROTEIN: Bardet-Biedl syndrome 10 protein n=1 Tax=Lethenteron reissneri TaxID=7753 RepID=UPI002AB6187A|nr:LOW QUALITY PROTEIN: Bardet-Biedl syndrome 10 protein [Lethenteron reissneri]
MESPAVPLTLPDCRRRSRRRLCRAAGAANGSVSGPLGAGAALAVAGALADTVGRCLGPACGSLLFARDTGDVLLMADGSRALAALRLEHPVARMVVECVLAHCAVTGDGAKSFVLLLASLLRSAGLGPGAAVTACCGSHPPTGPAAHERRETSSCRAFAGQVPALQTDVLDGIVGERMRRHMTLANLELERDLRDSTEGIVRTSLSCNLGAAAAEALVPAVLGLVFPHGIDVPRGTDVPRFGERVSFILGNFPEMCTEVSGAPVSRSCCLDGVLLRRDFTVRPSGEDVDGDVRFVAVTGRVRPLSSESLGVTWQYGTGSEFQQAQLWADRYVERFMETLARDGVGVLFSAVKQSDCLLHYARRGGLAVVECVPAEELAFLCDVAACEAPPTACGDTVARLAGSLTFCRRLELGGGRACVHAGVRRALSSLVVCSPVQGVASQYVAAVSGALKTLRMWATDVGRSADCSDGSVVVPAGAVLPAGGTFEFLLHHFLCEVADGKHEPVPTPPLRQACAVLAEALLEIPRRLHRNLRPDRRFVTLLSAVSAGLRTRGELDGRLLSIGGGVEPVAAKLQLVGAVLQCLQRLLRVDAVVRVTGRLLDGARGHHGDSEDDS